MFLKGYRMKRLVGIGIGLCLTFTALTQTLDIKDGLYYYGNEAYTGPYSTYYESGMIKMRCYFTDGMPDKSIVQYFENGSVSQVGFYKNGLQDGMWSLFNQGGDKVGEAHYVKGEKDGVWFLTDGFDNRHYHLIYNMGEKVGNWQLWDDQASLVAEREF